MSVIVAIERRIKGLLIGQDRGYGPLLYKCIACYVNMLVIKGDMTSRYLWLSTFKTEYGIIISMLWVYFERTLRAK